MPHPHLPDLRTAHSTSLRKQGSTGFWRIKQGYQRKKQGLDGKTEKRETTGKRIHKDDTIESKIVASIYNMILNLA